MSKTQSAAIGIRQRAGRSLLSILACAALLPALQGCVEMAVGSAVMGTIASTDRRTFGAQAEDKSIVVKGEVRASNIPGAYHVNVTSFNRKVLLTGEVQDAQVKAQVEQEIAALEGVQSVVNELEVAAASGFASRSSDALITGKVSASLVDTRDINANNYKVVTERSIVYLMGRVTQREGAIAAEVARGVSGVLKVVKVFEYITEGEARQASDARPAPPAAAAPAAGNGVGASQAETYSIRQPETYRD